MSGRLLMIQGTASSVGKSLLVAALCRILREDGLRVAPFKAQNMSLNSAVTPDGAEIARAQAMQAEAAGVPPTVEMNPVLLKPQGHQTAQVVVRGRVLRTATAGEYHALKRELWPAVTQSLQVLRDRHDAVVIEGAGSPAEVNLRDRDISNMAVALAFEAPVLLAGDIDRGGVLAAIVGTLELLAPEERPLVRGLVINKFRGDRALLESGLSFLEQRTGVPVLGVVPYVEGLLLPEEDSLDLELDRGSGPIEIAIIRLPRAANFDEFQLLAAEPAARVRFVTEPTEVHRAHCLIVPGSKATIADLRWLHQRGLAGAIRGAADRGVAVIGVCGGYQMLGEVVRDPLGVEDGGECRGIGLLPLETVFTREKRTQPVRARAATRAGWLSGIGETELAGYEIHMGVTPAAEPPAFSLRTADGRYPDGMVGAEGRVVGTYVHGLFENEVARAALLGWLAETHGFGPVATAGLARERSFERLAAAVRAALDMEAIYRLLGLGERSAIPSKT